MKELNPFKSLLLFAVLAIGSYALYEYQFAKKSEWQFKPFTKGYALFDSQIQITDEQGKIHTSIQSPEIIFYADSEITKIKQPAVIFKSGDSEWQIDSEHAELNSDQTELFFPQDVAMKSLGLEENSTINTSALTVFPEKQVANTAEQITFSQAGRPDAAKVIAKKVIDESGLAVRSATLLQEAADLVREAMTE